MKPIYMVIGCPGSGKSWVVNQITERFHLLQHDHFLGRPIAAYLNEIVRASQTATKPVLIEAPFSVSQIKDPLESAGFKVVPVFIQETPDVLRARYAARERKDIPAGHLTRQQTYRDRALMWGAFMGTSAEVLAHLRRMS